MAEFTNLDEIFFYRDMILDYIYNKYEKERFFEYVDYAYFKQVTLDEASLQYFGSYNDFWLFLFFNPELKIEELGLLNTINENEFVESKLNYIYKDVLGQNYYTNEQINKVFDSYHEYVDRKLFLPKDINGKTIKLDILNYMKKLYRGKN